MTVSGELGRRDVPPDWVVQRRVLGRRAALSALIYGGFIVLAAYLPVLLALASGWLGEHEIPLLLTGVTAALMVYLAGHYSELWRRNALARELVGRGAASLKQPIMISIGDRLSLETSRSTTEVDWALVSEVFPYAGAWVLLVAARPYPVPARFFADIESQRGFVRQVLAHVTEPARERSPEAREFVLWS
jgi:hypothetical protein